MISENGGRRSLAQLLIDAVVDYAIYMLDLEGRVVSWNSGGVRLKGYTAGEIIGQSFSRFYTPEGPKRPERRSEPSAPLARRVVSTPTVGGFGKMERDSWASVVIDAIRSEDGRASWFCENYPRCPFPERQLATQTLLDSESRYRRLIEASCRLRNLPGSTPTDLSRRGIQAHNASKVTPGA